jgi:hypothetical protein
MTAHVFGQKSIELGFYNITQAIEDASLNLPFRCNKGVSA